MGGAPGLISSAGGRYRVEIRSQERDIGHIVKERIGITMSYTLQKIRVEHLKFGMYVSRLDRPWLETNFLFQGFHVQSMDDIRRLREYCDYVYVDPVKGKPVPEELVIDTRRVYEDKLARIFREPRGDERYPIVTSVEEELKTARQGYDNTLDLVTNIMEDVKARRKIKIKAVRQQLQQMIASILRNPDAFLWLKQLKERDNYAYAHCVDASGLAIAFGRHLGLPQDELEHLAIGTLLFDIGKLQLPVELLHKQERLTDREYALIKRHVQIGTELVREMEGSNPHIVSVVLHHHERHDGRGYPRGVAGPQIPVNGRIAALVDCYDAITSERPYRPALSSCEAIKLLYDCRDKDFQSDMVEQFIQCIGPYPPGTLVELNTGEVGLVVAQNRTRRLRPRIMLVLGPDKRPYTPQVILDLRDDPKDAQGRLIEIQRPLPPGSHGIDVRDYYL